MSIPPETVFKALSDATRLRCLILLSREGELCVCELTHAIAMAQPKVSRHLALLRESGMVSDHRRGQWIFYRIHPALPAWACEVLERTARAMEQTEPFRGDRLRLEAMPDRPGAACPA
ncbi:MAG: metalloregulator ArsR/SmtB family transcription factor [Ectothiorhodospira sp.]